MRIPTKNFLTSITAGFCLSVVAISASAQTGQSLYFDVNGSTSGFGSVNGNTYSWDNALWSSSSAGTVATVNWTNGDFARFSAGTSGNSYTVTVGKDEMMAGLYETVSGVALTINSTGSGFLDVTNNIQGFLVSSSVTINATIGGAGGVAPELSGSLYLYGNNTYSGGTQFGDSGSTLTYFNNNNSFGTGSMFVNESSGSYAALLATGGSTITIANPWVIQTTNGGVNFASNPNTPVVTTGNWTLGTNNFNIRNNGGSGSPLTIGGVISGSGNVTFSSGPGGKINLNNINLFTGTTTIGLPGATNVTVYLGIANALASSSSIIMNGGTLNPGGFNHHMIGTTLGLTASSSIDFGAGASELDFAKSSGVAWSSGDILDLINWNPTLDSIYFGTDDTGLTSSQLGDIEFNGGGLGSAELTASGELIQVPEPSTIALGILGGLGLILVRRRKA